MYRWSHLKALVVKEFLEVWGDKKSRIVLILPAIIQLVVLTNAATLDVDNVSVGIANLDAGGYSQELIDRVQGSPFFKKVHVWKNIREANEALRTQKVLGVINVPADFSKMLAKRRHVSVEILLDGRKLNSAQIVVGYFNAIIQQLNEHIVQFWGDQVVAPIVIDFRSFFNENIEYIYYNAICLIAILGMLLALTVTAMSVSRERENGTFDQLLVSPLRPWEILVGKAIPALGISIGEGTLLTLVSIYLFNIPFRGSILLLYVATFVFLLSIVGIGLFISAISSTQQQSILGSFVFTTPSVILGGYATPVENMPDWLQYVAATLPLTHFFVIIKGILFKDIFASMVWNHIWPMALSAVCTLSLATWMFKKRLE